MGPPVPSDYPEFDPILVKCISYLQVGGKESRKHLKELINDLVKGDEKPDTPQTSRGSSPNVIAQPGKVDKRKGGQLDKDAVKKARLEQTATSHDHVLPRFTNKPGILTEPCSVCEKNTSSSKDQLIECNDCHQGYHQQCHDPPISDSVIQERQADTRFVWQCKQCLAMVTKISTNKKSEPKQKEKNPDSHVPFKRQDKLQNIKSTSSSREGSPSLTGWGSLMGTKDETKSERESEREKRDSKRKKEKKLQQIDMFGNNDSDNSSSGTHSKKKKEVNPSAIKALKDKTSRKKDEEKAKKSIKSKEKEADDAHKKLHSMKKKSAEKAKLKAAAKRV